MALLSLRGYSRHRKALGLVGGSLSAVQKAVARGWIQAESDSGIDPARADQSWAQLHVPKVFSDGRVTTATPNAGRARRRPRPWKPSDARMRYWRAWHRKLEELLDDMIDEADVVPDDEPNMPPTGIPQLDAYLDVFSWVQGAECALRQALDPHLICYEPIYDGEDR